MNGGPNRTGRLATIASSLVVVLALTGAMHFTVRSSDAEAQARASGRGPYQVVGGVGQGAPFPDGTAGSPGINWNSDSDTGFFRSASGETSYSANTTPIVRFNAQGIAIYPSSAYIYNENAAVLVNDSEGLSIGNGSGLETDGRVDADSYNLLAGGAVDGPAALASITSSVAAVQALAPTAIDAADLAFSAGIVSTPNLVTIDKEGDVVVTGRVSSASTLTVADSGDGSAAAGTLTPSANFVAVTCSDADGCNVTMSETGAVNGSLVTIVNVSANAANFADSAGVSELSGAIALGQNDSLQLIYATDRWVQVSTSNN